MRKVIIVNKEGEVLKTYKSGREAAADNQLDYRTLYHYLVGNHKQPCQRSFVTQRTGSELVDNNLILYEDVFSLHSEAILEAYNGRFPVHEVLKQIDQKAVLDTVTPEEVKAKREHVKNLVLLRKQRDNS